jgi:hypothetical protein
VKISYSCMPNINRKITSHNRAILSQDNCKPNTRTCNCLRPENCPLCGQCLTESIVYQAVVSTNDNNQTKHTLA